MPTDLNDPVTEGGLRHIPFFNGRVLTAEDLQTEQAAHATERRRLGRALGTGVLRGLSVQRASDTTVTVQSGQGLAPSGRVVELPRATEVSVLSGIEREETAGTTGAFSDCATREVTVNAGSGAYILVAEPASEPRGRTPRTGLGGDGAARGAAGECGVKHRVEGAKLRLVPFDLGDDALVPPSLADGEAPIDVQALSEKIVGARESGTTPPPEPVSLLRNTLAHVCLRTPSAPTAAATLYDTLRRQSQGAARSSGTGADTLGPDSPLDVLRHRARARDEIAELNDAVPLGLLYWAHDRIEFVDVWSVRRRVHRPTPKRPVPAIGRRRAESEAAIFQFQDHLVDLSRRLSFSERVRLSAENGFLYLPPFGTIPNEEGDRTGFDVYSFFDTLSTREYLYVEGTTLRSLVTEATQFDSFRTDTDQLVWRYRVREDVQSGDDQHPSFVVFTSGFVPHAAEPQYNLSRFGYANYGPGVALR
ncbi:MAG: hypothetical protein ABEL97_05070 [Salinibacter sp.]